MNGAALPMAGPGETSGNGSFELPLVHAGGGALPLADEHPPRWVSLEEFHSLDRGELRTLTVEGVELLLANVGGSLLAYRDTCASCGGPLHDGELIGNMLRCPGCLVEFDLPRAGRAAGGEPLQLTPVPLLETGGLRVAV
jgi:nitrite reductase/ring-hydroxylating ferredoxin subunit